MEKEMTLAEARQLVLQNRDEGVDCPCCGQLVKVYRYKINANIAYTLLDMYRMNGLAWIHLEQFMRSRDILRGGQTKMHYWGLAEMATERRDDGGQSGWWRVTPYGERWIQGRIAIPKYVLLYDGTCIGFEEGPVSIQEALATKFNYDELMAGV